LIHFCSVSTSHTAVTWFFYCMNFSFEKRIRWSPYGFFGHRTKLVLMVELAIDLDPTLEQPHRISLHGSYFCFFYSKIQTFPVLHHKKLTIKKGRVRRDPVSILFIINNVVKKPLNVAILGFSVTVKNIINIFRRYILYIYSDKKFELTN